MTSPLVRKRTGECSEAERTPLLREKVSNGRILMI